MKVHMSQAVAGIKGTRFVLTETGNESKIEVAEGSVVFQSKINGEEIIVSAGESVTATKNGLSDKTIFDSSVGQENWQTIDSPPEKKSLKDSNPNNKTIYLAGVMVILIFVGIAFVRKRK